jgi:Sulfotransferase domain
MNYFLKVLKKSKKNQASVSKQTRRSNNKLLKVCFSTTVNSVKMTRRVKLFQTAAIVLLFLLFSFFTLNSFNQFSVIEKILDNQRKQITEEMKSYDYPNRQFGVGAKNLQELTPETGGIPIRSIIVSTWRSGSTFLGDILNSLPGNFYHYEPLLNYGIKQIRGAPDDKFAVEIIKKLLKCNYTDSVDYLDYGKTQINLFTHNTRLWLQCQLFPDICFQPKFLEPFCKLFPLQSMKLVRLRTEIARSLLEDSRYNRMDSPCSLFVLTSLIIHFSLNVRIVLLMRDPRGLIQSRKQRDWCPGNPDCDDPEIVCKDMVSDFKAAVELLKEFPMTFK